MEEDGEAGALLVPLAGEVDMVLGETHTLVHGSRKVRREQKRCFPHLGKRVREDSGGAEAAAGERLGGAAGRAAEDTAGGLGACWCSGAALGCRGGGLRTGRGARGRGGGEKGVELGLALRLGLRCWR